MSDLMSIWNAVEKTDPKFTKEFNRGGGFKGTAINPTYLARKATEVFGPAGLGWGWKVLHEELMLGAPISEDCRELIHVLHVEVWYRPTREMCERYGLEFGYIARVNQYGATTFVGKNKYGPFTDEETKKKSLTDGIGKCLSLLGFSSDVHLGRYDDSKYVNDRRNEEAAKEKAATAAIVHNIDTIKKRLTECQDETSITEVWKSLGINGQHPQREAIIALMTERKNQLKPAANNGKAA